MNVYLPLNSWDVTVDWEFLETIFCVDGGKLDELPNG